MVTFCLSDIEGSTALWDAQPEAMADALVRHDELIADAVEAHGGSFIESMGEGDSTVSVFDSAPAAVEAALEANRALAARTWPPGIRSRCAGACTRARPSGVTDYLGPTVDLAARLRAQADGGQVFLSAVTAELVAGHLPEGYALVDLGPHRLRGSARRARAALAGPGVRRRSPHRVPVSRLPAFEAGDRRFFFGREDVVAEVIGRLAPGACWPSSARRAAASRRCCARGWSPPRAPARSTGCRTPRS